jgi:hypothetical protein
MSKLYELQEQLVAIDNVLDAATDSETQEILESAKEELLKTIDGKIESILDYIADCKAKAEQLKVETVRLLTKKTSLEKKVDYLKNMLMGYMKANDKKKESFGTWDITVAKTPEKVVLDACDDDFPEEYKRFSWDIDKTAIKNHIVDGKLVINGKMLAHTESGETIRIK